MVPRIHLDTATGVISLLCTIISFLCSLAVIVLILMKRLCKTRFKVVMIGVHSVNMAYQITGGVVDYAILLKREPRMWRMFLGVILFLLSCLTKLETFEVFGIVTQVSKRTVRTIQMVLFCWCVFWCTPTLVFFEQMLPGIMGVWRQWGLSVWILTCAVVENIETIFVVYKLYQTAQHKQLKRKSYFKLQTFMILVWVMDLVTTIIWIYAYVRTISTLTRMMESYAGIHCVFTTISFELITQFVFENPHLSILDPHNQKLKRLTEEDFAAYSLQPTVVQTAPILSNAPR
jgi:hypothetical protein